MSEDRDIRESVTVEYIGTFWGRPTFVEPFKTDEERDLFMKRLRQTFGLPEPEDEDC